jgi:PTH1 family peptidyl-tRNA hydrolase
LNFPMENFYLVVGLGNPGANYACTRHNIGFMAVERFAERRKASWSFADKFEARLARVEYEGHRLLLCQPQTYMNSSGTAVRTLSEYYKIGLKDLMVVVDDADLPLGEIRLRANGSSGGHHGLESIEQHLSTREYARLRIGIGRQTSQVREISGHVLGKFQPDERKILESILGRVASQLECWITSGILKAMNNFNGVMPSPMPKES